MLKNILKQQIIGVINLSIPVILLYQIYPAILLNPYGKIFCSLLIGTYVFFLNYKATKNQADSLKYVPSLCKPELEKIIVACSMDPKLINLRYGYSNEMIAMAMFNTISIDPILCQKFNQDPEALKVIDILNQHVIGTMNEKQKEKIEKIKSILTPEAQTFIFKHELGHAFANYSYKKLALVGIIGAISAYFGIIITFYFLKALGVFALLIGLTTAGLIDLVLSYLSNIIFKAREEKNADLFAAKFSSPEEIKAAANFFEVHQEIVNSDKTSDILSRLPSIVLTGHYDGKTRAKYLRTIVDNLVIL